MTKEIEYKPVRILKGISVAGSDFDDLAEKFPHAESEIVQGKKAKTHSRRFRPGMVVNAPTGKERELFDSLSKTFVVAIPQHKDGYDDPRSNLARSRDSSARGRQMFLIEIADRGEFPVEKRTSTSSRKSVSKKDEKSDKSSQKGDNK